jgi:hypothetical protein
MRIPSCMNGCCLINARNASKFILKNLNPFVRVYFILVGNSFQKRGRIGVFEGGPGGPTTNPSPLRMLKVNLPTFVKYTPFVILFDLSPGFRYNTNKCSVA